MHETRDAGIYRLNIAPGASIPLHVHQVMRESEQNQPKLKRLGDQLGAIYTPVAVGIAALAWAIGDRRSTGPAHLVAAAVLVVATVVGMVFEEAQHVLRRLLADVPPGRAGVGRPRLRPNRLRPG